MNNLSHTHQYGLSLIHEIRNSRKEGYENEWQIGVRFLGEYDLHEITINSTHNQ